METTLENGILTIALSGRIDGNNADETAKKLSAALEGQEFESLHLDAEQLEYISSAGLRVLLKLKKDTKKQVHIFNVSDAVYEIFDVTGFTDLLTVHRMPHEISIIGCKIVGRGTFGTVYRLDNDRIAKIFNTDRAVTLDRIEREKDLAREVFLQDIPTAISYDIVRAGSNYGIVFELLEAFSLQDYLMEHPDEEDAMTGKVADILQHLHHAEIEKYKLNDMKQMLLEMFGMFGSFFTEDEMARLTGLFSDVPERTTLVHGDFHPGNIMVTKKGELVLIDVGDISTGHPFFEFFNMYPSFLLWQEVEFGTDIVKKDMMKALNTTTAEETERACECIKGYWNGLLRHYFAKADDGQLAKIESYLKAVGRFKMFTTIARMPNSPEKIEEVRRYKELLLAEWEKVPPVSEWWISE